MTEEELEKEAEEYRESKRHKSFRADVGTVQINYESYLNNLQSAFQKGAEYGYNKAKEEWKKHFLQCSSPFCLDNFSEVKCYGELGNMTKKESE